MTDGEFIDISFPGAHCSMELVKFLVKIIFWRYFGVNDKLQLAFM
jgi:hypothetical protein